MVTMARINKKKVTSNPLKTRCNREIVYNTRTSDGTLLEPKQALEQLKEERAVIRFRLERGEGFVDLVKRYGVLEQEILMFELYLKNRAKRQKRYREVTKKKKSSVESPPPPLQDRVQHEVESFRDQDRVEHEVESFRDQDLHKK